jgi:hypothetical protein
MDVFKNIDLSTTTFSGASAEPDIELRLEAIDFETLASDMPELGARPGWRKVNCTHNASRGSATRTNIRAPSI